jgi:iron complex transport system substrate-binding protein
VFLRTTHHAVALALTIVALTACRAGEQSPRTQSAAIEVTDDAGDVVRLAAPARRVISLVPSATETIIAIGAVDRIVGRTRYDVAPEIAAVPSVGGTVDPSIEAVVALRPDLVIGWDTDKRREVRTKLGTLGIPVFSLRTQDTSDVFQGIRHLGRLLGRDSAAGALAASIRSQLDSVRVEVAGKPARSVLFVVYPNPPMTAGPHTFIDELIGLAGGRSIFSDLSQLWPTVSMEEIVRRRPDLLIVPQGELKDDSLARFRSRPGWRDLAAIRDGRVATVPADLVQRPGANIGIAARALQAAIHPETRRRP